MRCIKLRLEGNSDTYSTSSFGTEVQQNKLLVCSDGSAASKGGSFGYVISTSCGRQVAKGRGPAPGAHPNSFCSEAYGVLAALRWLRHALHEVPDVANASFTRYLDNKSVIRRIEQARTHTIDTPNRTLLPEHEDVITEITHTLTELPLHIEFKWVKGHQNASTAYSNLDVPAKTNCNADSEAALFHWQDNKQCTAPKSPPAVTSYSKSTGNQSTVHHGTHKEEGPRSRTHSAITQISATKTCVGGSNTAGIHRLATILSHTDNT